jgi:hypothetical protein
MQPVCGIGSFAYCMKLLRVLTTRGALSLREYAIINGLQ